MSSDEQHLLPPGDEAAAGLADGRYSHFIDRGYRLDGTAWGIFSLERLARTPEFRQAASDMTRADPRTNAPYTGPAGVSTTLEVEHEH